MQERESCSPSDKVTKLRMKTKSPEPLSTSNSSESEEHFRNRLLGKAGEQGD